MNKIQVNRSFCRFVTATCLFALAASVSYADPQIRTRSTTEARQVRGAVTDAGPGEADGLRVELLNSTGSSKIDEAWVAPTGEFEFEKARQGRYLLALKDRMGNVITQQHVMIGSYSGPLTIAMPKRDKVEVAGTGTVSLARLQHKPNKKAVKEFHRAAKALQKQEYEEATKLLEKAVEIDPSYMEAYTNLGACYMRAGRIEEAVSSLRKAVELDPGSAISFSNLAGALLTGRDYKEAANAARTAISLDPTSVQPRYVLGVALANIPNQEEEAVMMLDRVMADFPRARLYRAQALARLGNFGEAVAELKEFRAISAPEERPQIDLAIMRWEREANVPRIAVTNSQKQPN